jgi:SAM-dependent methyltransferase
VSASFKDHFSGHAAEYRASRPGYPPELFAWIAAKSPRIALAVDVGCGNGQASLGLATIAERVIAVDPSREQIAQAEAHPRVEYRVAPAERTGIDAATADMVLAAQSFHWFDHAAFFLELRRIAKPGALFVAAAYATCVITPSVDAAVHRLYEDILGGFWAPERRHVEAGLRDLPFPLDEVEAPPLAMVARWDLNRLRGYLGTWSALKAWQRVHGGDPREAIDQELAAAWGDPAHEREVRWPLAVRAGRCRTAG